MDGAERTPLRPAGPDTAINTRASRDSDASPVVDSSAESVVCRTHPAPPRPAPPVPSRPGPSGVTAGAGQERGRGGGGRRGWHGGWERQEVEKRGSASMMNFRCRVRVEALPALTASFIVIASSFPTSPPRGATALRRSELRRRPNRALPGHCGRRMCRLACYILHSGRRRDGDGTGDAGAQLPLPSSPLEPRRARLYSGIFVGLANDARHLHVLRMIADVDRSGESIVADELSVMSECCLSKHGNGPRATTRFW